MCYEKQGPETQQQCSWLLESKSYGPCYQWLFNPRSGHCQFEGLFDDSKSLSGESQSNHYLLYLDRVD